MKPSVDSEENKGRTDLENRGKEGRKLKNLESFQLKKRRKFSEMRKSVEEDGYCLGREECLDWRNLEKRARSRQEYEAIENQQVATVEIPVRKSVYSRQKYEAIGDLRVATVKIPVKRVVSSSNF